MYHSLVTLAIALVLGVALGAKLPVAPAALGAVAAALLAAVAIAARTGRERPSQALVLALVIALGAWRSQIEMPRSDPSHYLTQSAFGTGRFQAEVIGDPVTAGDVRRVKVALKAMIAGERKTALSGRARLVFNVPPEGAVDPVYGDVLEIVGTLAPPPDEYAGPGRPLKDVWAMEGVHGVLRPDEPIKRLATGAGFLVFEKLFELRRAVSGMLDQTHPPEVAGFLRTVLLGIRDVPPEPLADYRITGTYHLLSISGTHVGILALVLASFAAALSIPRRLAAVAILAVLGGYAVVAGGSAPVLRATCMASVFLIGQLAHRPMSVYTALALSAIGILTFDPLALFLPSFQLTFLAVLAIAYLTPPLMTRLDFLPPYLNALVSTSLAASLGTLPVLAARFGTLSLISPLANLLVVPLFGIVLPVAMLAIAGSLVSPWIPFFFGAANYGFVTLMNSLVSLLAKVPGASVDVSDLPPVVWTLTGLALVIAGDYHNLRETLVRRFRGGDSKVDSPAPEEIDSEALARTARELACLLPEDDSAADPISQRLSSVRGHIRAQAQELAPEFLMRCEALWSEPWARALDPLTIAYLGLAEAYFLAGRSPDKAPALLLLLKALEHELNVHLFGNLRLSAGTSRAQSLTGRYPEHPLVVFLASPPKNLSLEEQNELLWAMITNQERPLKGLARAIRRGLSGTLADANFFLDPSQFPLRLDQVYKRFYLRLDKEVWDWEGVRRAREEILGPKQENLFEQIGRALGVDSGSSAVEPVAPVASEPALERSAS